MVWGRKNYPQAFQKKLKKVTFETHVMSCYLMIWYVICFMLWYVMSCYLTLCYVMLCDVRTCNVMLCYVMLCKLGQQQQKLGRSARDVDNRPRAPAFFFPNRSLLLRVLIALKRGEYTETHTKREPISSSAGRRSQKPFCILP